MMTLLQLEEGKVKGWILARNINDLRKKAASRLPERNVLSLLHEKSFDKAGKHEIVGTPYLVLVE